MRGNEVMKSSESIVDKRLVRNLRYKLTYVRIFEDYLEAKKRSKSRLKTVLRKARKLEREFGQDHNC